MIPMFLLTMLSFLQYALPVDIPEERMGVRISELAATEEHIALLKTATLQITTNQTLMLLQLKSILNQVVH